jgi:hypothetical protein
MSDQPSSASPGSGKGRLSPSLRFDVAPYQPDGGCPLLGVLLLGIVMLAAAVGLGWLTSYVGQWFYLVLLAPVGLGFVLAGLGWLMVTGTKVRHGGVVFLIGLMAGTITLVAMHYYDYLRYRDNVTEHLRRPLERQLGMEAVLAEAGAAPNAEKENQDGKEQEREAELVLQRMGNDLAAVRQRLQAEVAASKSPVRLPGALLPFVAQARCRQAVAFGPLPYAMGVAETVLRPKAARLAMLAQLMLLDRSPLGTQIDPDVEAALHAWAGRLDLGDFLSLKAEEGTVFRLKRNKIPLHGSVLWGCWVVECLIAGMIAGLFMNRSQSPFCVRCEQWKKERPLGRLVLPAAEATEHLTSGALGQLSAAADAATEEKDGAHRDTIAVHVAVCPQCGPDGGIEVRLQKIKKKKDEEEKEDLVRVTYPGTALPALESLCPPTLDEAAVQRKR